MLCTNPRNLGMKSLPQPSLSRGTILVMHRMVLTSGLSAQPMPLAYAAFKKFAGHASLADRQR